jgi:hypothetical protein
LSKATNTQAATTKAHTEATTAHAAATERDPAS